jgi:hypothetical protein
MQVSLVSRLSARGTPRAVFTLKPAELRGSPAVSAVASSSKGSPAGRLNFIRGRVNSESRFAPALSAS